MAVAQGMTEWERCAARIFRWNLAFYSAVRCFYFTQRIFSSEFYPLALKKYTLFFSFRVVYA